MARIDSFTFENESIYEISQLTHGDYKVGENWPVVYLLSNDEVAYVGETVNVARRTEQHLKNKKKWKLEKIRIISDDDFNKSVALDLESYLITHLPADKKYRLLNGNSGLKNHEYYDKQRYETEFRHIWDQLRAKKIVNHTIEWIENSEMFKYSPYKTLGADQRIAEQDILRAFAEHRHDKDGVRIVVRGGAGTGKTILAVYLMKLFSDAIRRDTKVSEDDYLDDNTESVYASECADGFEKIGIVLPQPSLRSSIKDVFKGIDSLKAKMVMSATDVVNDYCKTGKQFDLLIVDEGHRLKTRKNGNLANNGSFKKCCEKLKVVYEESNELEWLCKCSKHLIIFRDDWQTVRPSDMDTDEFKETINKSWNGELVQQFLVSQWRCKGGNAYTDYIKDIFNCKASKFIQIKNYEFKLYDDVGKMSEDIKSLNEKHGLCRLAAGYAWEWKTDPRHNDGTYTYDIDIDGNRFKWNHTVDNWIGTNAVDEVGCIHTVQGYDLNYLGLIIGEDIKYDKKKGKIVADVNSYYDSMGKAKIADNPELLRDYLINIYLTLMTRGIHGTYVYVCDPALREYMSQFIEKA